MQIFANARIARMATSIFIIALLAGISFACKEKEKEKEKNEPPRGFTDLTFHSSRCFGTCPEISLNVDGEGNAQLLRFIFTGKGSSDSTRSGGFKGILSKQDLDTLNSLVNAINWDKMEWPVVTCCDRPVKTLMLGINGKRKDFKSMEWPKEANRLIEFLTDLGTNANLQRYNRPMDFEVMRPADTLQPAGNK